jgi:hypothetical protein
MTMTMTMTHRQSEVLFCEPHISSEPQPCQALIGVHLKDFACILRGRMPKDVVLNQHENSRTHCAGFQLQIPHELRKGEPAPAEEGGSYSLTSVSDGK